MFYKFIRVFKILLNFENLLLLWLNFMNATFEGHSSYPNETVNLITFCFGSFPISSRRVHLWQNIISQSACPIDSSNRNNCQVFSKKSQSRLVRSISILPKYERKENATVRQLTASQPSTTNRLLETSLKRRLQSLLLSIFQRRRNAAALVVIDFTASCPGFSHFTYRLSSSHLYQLATYVGIKSVY